MNKYIISTFLLVTSFVGVSAQSSSTVDFFVQDVCLGASGEVLTLSPASPLCSSRRNLKPGESLPYHKHDQRGNNTDPQSVNGYQRSDSFPSNDGLSTVQTFDFGVGGATFGIKDGNDGFNVYETRGGYASLVATQDATGGIQFFLSPTCTKDASGFKDINDSWIIAPNVLSSGLTGATTSLLKIEKNITTCPSLQYDKSLTFWDVPSGKLGYTSGDTLNTLLSYHYSHPSVAESDHLEKFFFTDEFGPTRWERWERPNTPYHSNEKERSETQALTGTCNGPSETSDGVSSWYRVDCREWTKIIETTKPEPAQDWSSSSVLPEVTCTALNYNLSIGSLDIFTKGEVSKLQKFLGAKGFYLLKPSGYFGIETSQALKSFQASNKLFQTGSLNLQTRTFIKNMSCKSFGTASAQSPAVLGVSTSATCINLPMNLRRGVEKPSVVLLQSFLLEKGFMEGEVTGFYGDKTVGAVKDYQASTGLPVTGMVYNFTREAIRAESCR